MADRSPSGFFGTGHAIDRSRSPAVPCRPICNLKTPAPAGVFFSDTGTVVRQANRLCKNIINTYLGVRSQNRACMGHRQGWNFHNTLKNRKRRGSCMNQAGIWQAVDARREPSEQPATDISNAICDLLPHLDDAGICCIAAIILKHYYAPKFRDAQT